MAEVATTTDYTGNYYRSLRRNMVFVMTVLSFAPMLMITVIIGYYFDTSYKQRARDHLVTLVAKHKQHIDTFLNERVADVRLIARTVPLRNLEDSAALGELLGALQEESGRFVVDLGLVDERGIQVSYAGPFKLRNADYSLSSWFPKALGSEDFVSDVFTGLRKLPHFIVSTTIHEGGRRWILKATVDFETFTHLVENIRIGSTGFAYILNREGESQTKSKLESPRDLRLVDDMIEHIGLSSDKVCYIEGRNVDSSPHIFVGATLRNGRWLLVFQQDEYDAYSVLVQARRTAFSVVVIGGFVIVIGATLLSRRMVSHIAHADIEKEMMNEQMIEAGKLASLGELAAGIAHEINNPVAIMVEEAGWIEDILNDPEMSDPERTEEFHRSLNQIRTQGRRCKEITHKLLSFARKTDPTPKSVSLNDLVADVVSISEQRARFSNVKIVVDLEEALPLVAVSPSEIQQVLLNMINNSVDAMENSGGVITIGTSSDGGYVFVEVADNGPGIAKAYLPRIFDPFFTTKPVGKGTGLGLSICYGIIKRIGGEITVQSDPGAGTSFLIKVPRPKADDSRPFAGPGAAAQSGT